MKKRLLTWLAMTLMTTGVVLVLSACDVEVERAPYTLTLSLDGEGAVTPVSGTTSFATPTRVSLEATPSEGWLFSHWEGPVDNRNLSETSIIVDGTRVVQAVFKPVPLPDYFEVTLAVTGAGTTFPAPGVHTVAKDDLVHLEALPAPGYEFIEWRGEVDDPFASLTTAPSNVVQTITAVFAEITEMRFYRDEDLESPLHTLDLGLWLDGYEGPYTTVYLYSTSFTDETVDRITLSGEMAELFTVSFDTNLLPARGVMAVQVRYRGEVDPGTLGVKSAELVVEGSLGTRSLTVKAEPVVDDVWALHTLVAEEITIERVLELIDVFAERTYPEALLATGILHVHVFALGEGNATQAVAMAAYQALEASMIDSDLRVAYHGVASGFVASILGATGGAYIDTMQALFQSIDAESSDSWLALYWKGVTYLRTSEGIMANFFSRLFYGSRVNNIWVPGGTAALAQVVAQYDAHNMPDSVWVDGFTYDRATMPVPEEIYQDILTVPYFN
ncbi:MAG: hypothetical protein EA374_05505 [Acholeplasmatales bacterium]|nr:MAG: hypothetical protein EA374_05505 [Acholeplasmatales bacterium]